MELLNKKNIINALLVAALVALVTWIFVGCAEVQKVTEAILDTTTEVIVEVSDTNEDGEVDEVEIAAAIKVVVDASDPLVPGWLRALLEMGGIAALGAYLRWRNKGKIRKAIDDERDTDTVLKERYNI